MPDSYLFLNLEGISIFLHSTCLFFLCFNTWGVRSTQPPTLYLDLKFCRRKNQLKNHTKIILQNHIIKKKKKPYPPLSISLSSTPFSLLFYLISSLSSLLFSLTDFLYHLSSLTPLPSPFCPRLSSSLISQILPTPSLFSWNIFFFNLRFLI